MGIDLNINDLLIAGVLACLFMDTFQRLLFITLQIPASNWGMVGRWTAYAVTRGKIINLASMYSFFGSGLVPSYAAAKGAIVQLTKSMAIELAPHNIQVNAIAPGWVQTEMTAAVQDSPMSDEIVMRTPAGRWGRPDEMAGAAVFLASPAADFVTGVTIPVDGGYAVR